MEEEYIKKLKAKEQREHAFYFGALAGYVVSLGFAWLVWMYIIGSYFSAGFSPPWRPFTDAILGAILIYFLLLVGCLIIGFILYFYKDPALTVVMSLPAGFAVVAFVGLLGWGTVISVQEEQAEETGVESFWSSQFVDMADVATGIDSSAPSNIFLLPDFEKCSGCDYQPYEAFHLCGAATGDCHFRGIPSFISSVKMRQKVTVTG